MSAAQGEAVDDERIAEVLAAVMRQHRLLSGGRCTCGEPPRPGLPWVPTHEAHVVAEQTTALAPLLQRDGAE